MSAELRWAKQRAIWPISMSSKGKSKRNLMDLCQSIEEEDDEEPFTENDEVISAESSPDHGIPTISEHRFGEIGDVFSISIIENMKEEYGFYVWPCSIILAEYIWQQKSRFFGANVIELGAGTSLPGLVAVKVGAYLALTDDSNRSEFSMCSVG